MSDIRHLVGLALLPRGPNRQQLHEERGVNRFDEMVVETCLFSPATVFLLAPTGESDNVHLIAPWLLPDAAAQIVAVELGHTDIEQYDVRLLHPRGSNSSVAIVSRVH